LLPTGKWPAYILLFGILLALVLAAKIDFIYLLKRSALSLPFLLAALPLMFQQSGALMASFHIGLLFINISREGFIHFISLGCKSWLSVSAAILLASTTSFPELLQAMRSMHIPQLLVAVFGLMWRYLYLMVEEADRLNRARVSRSGTYPSARSRKGGSPLWRARVTGAMVGSLFIRSLERSERVYNAMLSRGYDGEIRTLIIKPLSSKAIWGLVFSIALLILLILFFTLPVGP
jgi:cobalt/nickel transport system permease protein